MHILTDCVQMQELQDNCYTPHDWSTKQDLASVNVYEPTIRTTQKNNGGYGRDVRRKPLFSKRSLSPICSL